MKCIRRSFRVCGSAASVIRARRLTGSRDVSGIGNSPRCGNAMFRVTSRIVMRPSSSAMNYCEPFHGRFAPSYLKSEMTSRSRYKPHLATLMATCPSRCTETSARNRHSEPLSNHVQDNTAILGLFLPNHEPSRSKYRKVLFQTSCVHLR